MELYEMMVSLKSDLNTTKHKLERYHQDHELCKEVARDFQVQIRLVEKVMQDILDGNTNQVRQRLAYGHKQQIKIKAKAKIILGIKNG